MRKPMAPHAHPQRSTNQVHLGVVDIYLLVATASAVLLMIFQLDQCAYIATLELELLTV